MTDLEKKLDYRFRDQSLLHTALTHSSYANENRSLGAVCNERLEFLGDSVLGVLVAGRLYHRQPEMPEGEMTRLRADLVCEQSLAAVAQELRIGEALRLGRGEEHTGGRKRPSILADAVEAVLAAIWLDGGFDEAQRFVDRFVLSRADVGKKNVGDYKTQLQELVQRRSNQSIQYVLAEESGPDHNKRFTFEVRINGVAAGTGSGRTKKEAEQMAAKQALETLQA